MGSLDKIGIAVERTTKNGTTKFRVTLPKPWRIKASFSREGAGQKVAKLFTRELQTGDLAFDQDVYIKTDTRTHTAELLGLAGVRQAIARIVRAGGEILLESPSVQVELPGEGSDDSDIATIVQEMMAISERGLSE